MPDAHLPRALRAGDRCVSLRSAASELLSCPRGSGASHSSVLPVDRMLEREPRGVQRLALEATPARRSALGRAPRGMRRASAVHRIAHERKADVREVHANLMRAPRLELRAHERVPAKPLAARGSASRPRAHRRARPCACASVRCRPIGSSTVPPPVITPTQTAR